MESVTVPQQVTKEDAEQGELRSSDGVPVCGANLSSPVIDTAYYIDEVHYKIGNRMYVENAD